MRAWRRGIPPAAEVAQVVHSNELFDTPDDNDAATGG